LKLVLEGGGIRAAYSAGVLQSLYRAGIRFDAVVGSSTGGVNAAYFAAGQPDVVARIWREVVPDDFISYRRLLTPWGTPALDVDRMMDQVLQSGWSALDVEAALAGSPALHVVATDVTSGEPVVARPMRENLFEWLRASAAIPVGYNRIVEVEGRRLVDGGISAPVAHDLALEDPVGGPTVVLLTRPMTTIKPPPAWWHRMLLRTIVPPAVRTHSIRQHEHHNALMQRLAAARERGDVIVVDPPEDMTLRRLTRKRPAIERGIAIGTEVGEALAEELRSGSGAPGGGLGWRTRHGIVDPEARHG